MKNKTLITNQFNLNTIVKISNCDEEYRIVQISLDTLTEKCKTIWYDLYRLSDGYVCTVNENLLIKFNNMNEI